MRVSGKGHLGRPYLTMKEQAPPGLRQSLRTRDSENPRDQRALVRAPSNVAWMA